MSLRRSNDDKMSWKDQISPRIMGLRGFRRASESAKMREPERDFTITHHPDRPARRITEADIPSEEECKAFLVRARKASFAEQLQRRQDLEFTRPTAPLRSTFGPFKAPFTPLSPAEEESNPFDDSIDPTQQEPRRHLQVPETEARISNFSEEGFGLTRPESPQPEIVEAKQIKLERVENLSPLASPDASPTSTPRLSSQSHDLPRRKQSVQMVAIQRLPQESPRRRPSVQTVVISRRSRAPESPGFHPVQVHVRQDSSDPLCRVCHVGIAESTGICSSCGDEYSAPTSPAELHHDLVGNNSFPRHLLNLPSASKKLHRPPPLVPQSLNSITSLHRPSDQEANQPSPPPSPLSACGALHTVMTVPVNAPPTPISMLSTPDVFQHFPEHMHYRTDTTADAPGGDDVYGDGWAEYYFDEQNFSSTKPRGAKELMSPDVQGFMQRELTLEEFDGALASPVNPGPGWI
ncbi:hypothetical protein FZEAL_7241 [Fusarium zealandicum]|uniref:Uncharacterized protein n=1 Tax=Fusarium zealandicum TaxID=1053134 RepID=A0A8H4XIU7_9HYPO|nr:hypothetical protein FZEAL_7241 [Fusarium zealandicum]